MKIKEEKIFLGFCIAFVNEIGLPETNMKQAPSKIAIGIKILLKKDLLDVQGKAIEDSLRGNQFSLLSCQVGKYIKIQVEETRPKKALLQVKKMAEFALYNPLIEVCEFEILES